MRNLWLVMAREYVETVRTKAFIIALLIPLVLMVVAGVVGALLEAKGEPQQTVLVVDYSGIMGEKLCDVLSKDTAKNVQYELRDSGLAPWSDAKAALVEEVNAGRYNGGLLMLTADVAASGAAEFYTRNVTNQQLIQRLRAMLQGVVQDERIRASGVDPRVLQQIYKPLELQEFDLTRKIEAGDEGRSGAKSFSQLKLFASIFFTYILLISIMSTAQMALYSTVEEKSNRVVEVLLSSVSPWELMAGKVLGSAAVGATVLGFYAACLSGGAALLLSKLPDTPDLREITRYVFAEMPDFVLYFLLFYVLGYLFYSALMCAAGAATNSIREAQSLMGPLVMLMMVPPMVAYNHVISHPMSGISTTLSFVPPLTPFIMMMRIPAAGGDLPTWQIWLAVALLGVSVFLSWWIAGRIFRVGLLMYGKPPKLWEVLRWVRYK